MPTRDDVALKAGVSSATVSRVFNDPESVSIDKRNIVLKAATALGYKPDKNASALRRNGTGIILFVEKQIIRNPDSRFYYWFYADIIKSIQQVVDTSMYRLELFSYTDPSKLKTIAYRADRILCYSSVPEEDRRLIASSGIPTVFCMQGEPPEDFPYCASYIDEFSGGKTAGSHFVKTGHRHPAHITGALSSMPICRARWQGFKSVFSEPPMLIDGTIGIKGGYESGLKLVHAIKTHAIDSIFVVNDLTCIGVVNALKDNGIQIPQDVSIIGYDNLPFIHTLPFKLTTIDIRMSEAYRRGAQVLVGAAKDLSSSRIRIEPKLARGESVKKNV